MTSLSFDGVLKVVKREKSLIFIDQLLTSAFNFFLVVLISQNDPEYVADYGLAFSFALVVIGVYKNCAITPFLTHGGRSLTELFFYFKSATTSKFVSLPIVSLAAFALYHGILLHVILVILYFFILEALKVYSISLNKIYSSILYFVTSYSFVLITIFFVPYYLAFSVGIIPLVLLVFKIYKKEKKEVFINKSIDNASAFWLTLSFSIYSHGPLWFLYTFIPELAPLYVQLRSLFQPLLVLSRAADLIEKKSAAQNKSYDFKQLKQVIKYYLLVCIPAVILLMGLISLVFELLYGKVFDQQVLFSAILFAVLSLLMVISKPLETFFFKINELKAISKTRIIASAFFICFAPLVFYLPENRFYSLLLLMNFSWLLMNIINFYQAQKLSVMTFTSYK